MLPDDPAPCSITITHWPSVKTSTEPSEQRFTSFTALVHALTDAAHLLPSFQGDDVHPGLTFTTHAGQFVKPVDPASGKRSDWRAASPEEYDAFDPKWRAIGPRCKASCTAVHMLALEHDAGTVKLAHVHHVLSEMGSLALIYSSKSHTPAAHRLRILIALSRAVSLAEREILWRWASRVLADLSLAQGESHNAVMFWFWPSLPTSGDPFEFKTTDGDPLNVDALIEEQLAREAQDKPAPAPPPPLGALALPTSSRYGTTALENAYKELCATSAERHGTLARVAFKIGGLVGSRTVTYSEAEQALQQGVRVMFASEPGRIERDGYRTIRDQLARGQLEPIYPPARYQTPAPKRSAQPMPNSRTESTETVWSAGPSAPAVDHAARLIELLSAPTALADAFDPTVIEHAAHLAPLCKEFQQAVVLAKAAGVGIRDWKKAVSERRAQLEQDRKGQALAASPDAPEAIAQIRAGIDAALLRSPGGKLRATPANAMTIFANDPRIANCFAYQAMADRVTLTRAPEWHRDDAPSAQDDGPANATDSDVTRAQCWLAREWGLDLGFNVVAQAVEACAQRQWIDPLKDYFASLAGQWDGQPRLATWLAVYMGAAHNTYSREIGTRWLISGVARALQPGCKVDCVLVFEGGQGAKKSSALRTLAPQKDLFFDDVLKVGSKEAAETIRGKFLIELSELAAIKKHSDLEVAKGFVTREIDTYRPSFGRYPRDFKRRCIFAGSTNEREYLIDDTGNRRWWPVRIEVTHMIDLAALREDRDQLWAEALALYQAGAEWWVERNTELEALCVAEQAQREKTDPWAERVEPWLAERADEETRAREHHAAKARHLACPCVDCAGVTLGAVLSLAVGLDVPKQTDADASRAAKILRALGWDKPSKARMRQAGQRVRPFWPPGHPRLTDPEEEPAEE